MREFIATFSLRVARVTHHRKRSQNIVTPGSWPFFERPIAVLARKRSLNILKKKQYLMKTVINFFFRALHSQSVMRIK